MRVFISLNIPKEIKKEIKKIQNKLPEFNGKITEENNLHLTLKFLGEISEQRVEEIRKKLRKINFRKFKSSFDFLGVFSSSSEEFIRIIWVHLTNCENLQKKIDNSLEDLFEKEKRFMSHLTIARVKNIKDKQNFAERINKINFEKREFEVSKFCLMKSTLFRDGPKYELIEEYNLVQ